MTSTHSDRKLGFAEHVGGMAAGFYCFTLAVFDNELYVKGIYLAAILMLLALGYRLFFGGNRSINYSGFLWFYVALAVWSSMSALWAVDVGYIHHWMMTTFQIAISIFLLTNLVRSNATQLYVFMWLLFAVGVNLAFYFGIIHVEKPAYVGTRYVGMLGNANELSRTLLMFFVVALYVVVAEKSLILRMLAIFGMAAAFLVILATESRAAIIVSGLFLFGAVLLSPRKVFMLPLVFMASLLAIKLMTQSGDLQEILGRVIDRFLPWFSTGGGVEKLDSSTTGRIHLVGSAWDMFLSSPAIGHGIGGFYAKHGSYTHNAPLDILANLGIVGLALWWAGYFVILRRIRRHSQNVVKMAGLLALAAVFIIEMADVFYTSRTGLAVMTLILIYFGSDVASREARSITALKHGITGSKVMPEMQAGSTGDPAPNTPLLRTSKSARGALLRRKK